MPLSKKRDKERKRLIRLENQKIQPKIDIPGLELDGGGEIRLETELVQPKLYNPMKHRHGDRVMVQRGKQLVEVVIPELDADGQPIPDY